MDALTKKVLSVAQAKTEARRADSAARAMAEHCDERIAKMRLVLHNARVSLVAFGGDPTHIKGKRAAEKAGVDMVQWTLLREIDKALCG